MASGFLKGTLILTIAGFVVKAIGSINWILLSRILGGEGIGIYQMAFPIYLLLLQISSAGVPIAISILTAERLALHDFGGAKRVFNISFTMLTITGFIASLAMYFGADWLISSGLIAESRAYYSIIALAPAVFFVTWISCFRGYIQGYEMMTPTAISQIVEQLLRVIVMLGAAAILLPYGLPAAAGGASSVSYTHLDVYKRQRWYTPVNPSRSKIGNVDSVVWQLNNSSHTSWDAPSKAA